MRTLRIGDDDLGASSSGDEIVVRSPYDGHEIDRVPACGSAEVERAVAHAVAVHRAGALPTWKRAEILDRAAQLLGERTEQFARIIAEEAAKPIKTARVEAKRAVSTFTFASVEARRLAGEMVPLDASDVGDGKLGFTLRLPIGVVGAISPFNFPLNLVAHKLAPAIAAGCPVVLKPASQTPISALTLAGSILEAGGPAAALSVLPMSSKDATALVEDDRFKLLTFTGSPVVGWDMKRRAGRKRVTLELGGNAGCIIHSDADLAFAAERVAVGGFSYAGQSCISVQRVFVHEPVYEEFMDSFVPKVRALKVGHPLDEATDLGSLISAGDAERVGAWLQEARAAGAECLVGGDVKGGVVSPTVVVKAGPELRVNAQEVFAPVVTVQTYADFEDALYAVNNSDFGLQAGVFTRDVRRIFRAYEELEVGGLIVDDVPTWRIDPMPYGGVKQSGFGREGLKYAIEE